MIKNPDQSISDVQKIIQWHLKTIYNIIFTVEKGKAYLHTSYENNYDKRMLLTVHYIIKGTK